MAEPQLANEPFISEPLTWQQIRERYPDQWVCVVEVDYYNDHDFGFRTARVVGHGKDPRDSLIHSRPARAGYRAWGHYSTRLAREPFPRVDWP